MEHSARQVNTIRLVLTFRTIESPATEALIQDLDIPDMRFAIVYSSSSPEKNEENEAWTAGTKVSRKHKTRGRTVSSWEIDGSWGIRGKVAKNDSDTGIADSELSNPISILESWRKRTSPGQHWRNERIT